MSIACLRHPSILAVCWLYCQHQSSTTSADKQATEAVQTGAPNGARSRWLTCWKVHWLTCWLIGSLTGSFTGSLTCWLTGSVIRSLAGSLAGSLGHCLPHCLAYWLLLTTLARRFLLPDTPVVRRRHIRQTPRPVDDGRCASTSSLDYRYWSTVSFGKRRRIE